MTDYDRRPHYYVYFKDPGDRREDDVFGVTQSPAGWGFDSDRMSRADLLDLVRDDGKVVRTAEVDGGALTT